MPTPPEPPAKPPTMKLSPKTVELLMDLTPAQLEEAIRITAKLLATKAASRAATKLATGAAAERVSAKS